MKNGLKKKISDDLNNFLKMIKKKAIYLNYPNIHSFYYVYGQAKLKKNPNLLNLKHKVYSCI